MSPLGASLAVIRAAGSAGTAGAEYAVGSFTKINTTGTQAVSGVGFTPKAIVFWTSGSNAASGTWSGDVLQTLGFTAGPANSYSVAGSAFDAVATSVTNRRIAAKAITFLQSGDAVQAEADLQSLDADGFTLNWTTNSANVNYDNIVYNFLAIGGADVSAKVVTSTAKMTTGTQGVTGVGFTPDVVLHASSSNTAVPQSGAHHYFSLGAMDAAGGQWANAIFSFDNAAAADTARYQRTDKAFALLSNATTVDSEAAFQSMDADGFTLNWTNAAASGWQLIHLCLAGVNAKVGSFTKSIAAAPAAQSVTGLTFQPSAVLFTSDIAGATTSVLTNAFWGMGATDGTNERAAAQADVDAADPTQADSLFSNAKAIVLPTTGPSVSSEADVALTADGFDLTWTTNAGVASQVLYLALGG